MPSSRAPFNFWQFADLPPAEAFLAMIQAGLSVIPVSPDTKSPLISEWAPFQQAPPSLEEARDWLERLSGRPIAIGLLTGPVNGWVVIDVDDHTQMPWVSDTFPQTSIKQATSRGVHLFYRQGERTIPSKANIAGHDHVDVRGKGGYIIIAPSVIQGRPREIQVEGEPDLAALPTLDDLTEFDTVFHIRRQRIHVGEGFADGEIVCGGEDGLVTDGRDTYLRNLIFGAYQDAPSRQGRVLDDTYELARIAWEQFEAGADLSDDKWRFGDALGKAAYLLQRVRDGVVSRPCLVRTTPLPDAVEVDKEEAKRQLKTAIQDYLEYRSAPQIGAPARHFLIRSPAGLGKTTTAIDLGVDYVLHSTPIERWLDSTFADNPDVFRNWLFFVRTHVLGREIKGLIDRAFGDRGLSFDTPVWRGRNQVSDDTSAPCQFPDEARQLANRGVSVAANLCERFDHGSGQYFRCPHIGDCNYFAARRRHEPLTIVTHSEIRLIGYDGAELNQGGGENPSLLSHMMKPLKWGSSFLIDETPIDCLVDSFTLPRSALDRLVDPQLANAMGRALDTGRSVLLSLDEAGFTPERLRSLGRLHARREQWSNQVATPGNPPTIHNASHRNFRLSTVLKYLADELGSGRRDEAYSLRLTSDPSRLRVQARHKFPLSKMPGLILDATGNETVLRQFMPNLKTKADIHVRRNACFTQVKNKTFSRSSLMGAQGLTSLGTKVVQYLKLFADGVSGGESTKRTLVVTYKKLRPYLTGETAQQLPPSSPIPDTTIDVGHFGNIRGLDMFKDHQAVVILGRQQPPPEDMENQARAIWYDSPDPVSVVSEAHGYPRQSGVYDVRGFSAPVPTMGHGVAYHPDPRVHALLEQSREAETLQAIDRLRLVHNETPKQVIILSNIPLPGLRIDRLLTWSELLAGGTHLERAIAEAGRRGWDALPLNHCWLSETFPSLWGGDRSVEAWIRGNNPPSSININRTSWVIHRYRQAGAGGSASTAYIKEGIASPTHAIEQVLGTPVRTA